MTASVDVALEGETFRLSQSFDDRFQWSEHGRRDTGDRSETHADGSASSFGPVRHREPGGEAADQLPTFVEELTRRCMELLDRNEQIACDEVTFAVAPCRAANRAAFGPDTEVANRVGVTLVVVPMGLGRGGKRQGDRLGRRLSV